MKKAPVPWNKEEPNYSAQFDFVQDSDNCQSNQGMQNLKVEVVTSACGHFLRLTTGKNGWSIEGINDLLKLLKFVEKVQSNNEQISGA